jgi:proteasome lid subunit RPN8/RPN11
VIVTPEELEVMKEQAVAEYPREACGVTLVRDGERRLLRCRNDQDELHRRDPDRYPRDARTAYHIADTDRLEMLKLEDQGFAPHVIYHSHVDAGAYFSETDVRQAMLQGEPMYPETTYVVVSVVSGRVEDVAAFRWDPKERQFPRIELGVAYQRPDEARR